MDEVRLIPIWKGLIVARGNVSLWLLALGIRKKCIKVLPRKFGISESCTSVI